MTMISCISRYILLSIMVVWHRSSLDKYQGELQVSTTPAGSTQLRDGHQRRTPNSSSPNRHSPDAPKSLISL